MKRDRFLFYTNWKEQINLMTNPELRRFNLNLIKYHTGEPVELISKIDQLIWAGILPALESNNEKYESRVKANQENGKKGGAPIGNQNAKKEETTQNNPNNPITDKREVISDKGQLENDNSEEDNDKGQEGNRQQINDDNSYYTGTYTGAVLKNEEVEEINKNLNADFKGAEIKNLKSLFRKSVKEKLAEKILETGYFDKGIFTLLKNGELKSIQSRMAPINYYRIEHMLLEYIEYQ